MADDDSSASKDDLWPSPIHSRFYGQRSATSKALAAFTGHTVVEGDLPPLILKQVCFPHPNGINSYEQRTLEKLHFWTISLNADIWELQYKKRHINVCKLCSSIYGSLRVRRGLSLMEAPSAVILYVHGGFCTCSRHFMGG